MIFLFQTNDDTGAITSWHRQENAIKIPESPNPRNFILFIIKPYQRLIKRDSETMDRKYEEGICGTPCEEIPIKILLSVCVNEKD